MAKGSLVRAIESLIDGLVANVPGATLLIVSTQCSRDLLGAPLE